MITDNSAAGGSAMTVFANITEHVGLVSRPGQISHRGRQIQLELGLDPSEAARLTDAQLPQASQAMPGRHPPTPVLAVAGALPQNPRLLKQGFLAVPVQPVRLPAGTMLRAICPAGQAQLPPTRPVMKSSLGKRLRSGRPGTRATSFRPASAKAWRAPPPQAVSPMASDTGTPALASLCSTNSNAPRLSGAFPGSTSTAVINWVLVSTTTAALCPSKRRLLLLWPWRISGSCIDTGTAHAAGPPGAG